MGKKRGLPPPAKTMPEFEKFKDFLRRIVAVPRKAVGEKMKEFKARPPKRSET